ncbi:MAG: hypothetical protein V3U87_13915 [Methylococcaceae bacterium]
MHQNIIDWHDFCKNKQNFDTSHFYTLFFIDEYHLTNTDLMDIFQYFNQPALLTKKVLSVYDVQEQTNKTEPTNEATISNLVLKDIGEKLRICDEFLDDDDFPSPEILEYPITFTNNEGDFDIKKNDLYNNIAYELLDCVGDALINILDKENKAVWALLEAFYGLTTDFTLKWYLASPMYLESVNFNAYFNLWSSKADYLITEKEILVFKPL